MEVSELMNLIVNNGFAVAISAYLLIRLEKQIIGLSNSIKCDLLLDKDKYIFVKTSLIN